MREPRRVGSEGLRQRGVEVVPVLHRDDRVVEAVHHEHGRGDVLCVRDVGHELAVEGADGRLGHVAGRRERAHAGREGRDERRAADLAGAGDVLARREEHRRPRPERLAEQNHALGAEVVDAVVVGEERSLVDAALGRAARRVSVAGVVKRHDAPLQLRAQPLRVRLERAEVVAVAVAEEHDAVVKRTELLAHAVLCRRVDLLKHPQRHVLVAKGVRHPHTRLLGVLRRLGRLVRGEGDARVACRTEGTPHEALPGHGYIASTTIAQFPAHETLSAPAGVQTQAVRCP